MPPEFLVTRRVDVFTDVYSFAGLIFEVFTEGKLPFFDLDNQNLVEHLIRSTQQVASPSTSRPLLSLSNIPRGINAVMHACSEVNKQLRPSFVTLAKMLEPKNWSDLLDLSEDEANDIHLTLSNSDSLNLEFHL